MDLQLTGEEVEGTSFREKLENGWGLSEAPGSAESTAPAQHPDRAGCYFQDVNILVATHAVVITVRIGFPIITLVEFAITEA
jgi:hypothetical protein